MARYIDAEKLEDGSFPEVTCEYQKGWNDALAGAMLGAPTVADVVEVVRCKDCTVPHNKWTGCPNLNGMIPPPDFYCARGERKEERPC